MLPHAKVRTDTGGALPRPWMKGRSSYTPSAVQGRYPLLTPRRFGYDAGSGWAAAAGGYVGPEVFGHVHRVERAVK